MRTPHTQTPFTFDRSQALSKNGLPPHTHTHTHTHTGPEDSEQPGELEPIQQELEELVEREKKLIELMSDISGRHTV